MLRLATLPSSYAEATIESLEIDQANSYTFCEGIDEANLYEELNRRLIA